MSSSQDRDDHAWRLIHVTYGQALESLERNEEMGERRLQVLFTVASAAAVAVGLVAEPGGDAEATLWAAAGAASIVSLIGLLTVLRLARRNLRTTELIDALRSIRRELVTEDSELRRMFPYDPYEIPSPRVQSRKPTKGGLVDIAGCSSAAFIGSAVLFAILAVEAHYGGAVLPVLGVAVGVAVAVGAWLGQVALVNKLYGVSGMSRGQFFRAGVGIVVSDGNGQVLAIQRADAHATWQFPQGGLEAGEEPEVAARRELREETGLSDPDVELLDHTEGWLSYELPPAYRSTKTGRGQVQQWFLFKTRRGTVLLLARPSNEVRAVAWMSFDALIDGAVDFRRELYRQIRDRFAL